MIQSNEMPPMREVVDERDTFPRFSTCVVMAMLLFKPNGSFFSCVTLKTGFCDSIPTLPLCANPQEIYIYCTLCNPGSFLLEHSIDNSCLLYTSDAADE